MRSSGALTHAGLTAGGDRFMLRWLAARSVGSHLRENLPPARERCAASQCGHWPASCLWALIGRGTTSIGHGTTSIGHGTTATAREGELGRR